MSRFSMVVLIFHKNKKKNKIEHTDIVERNCHVFETSPRRDNKKAWQPRVGTTVLIKFLIATIQATRFIMIFSSTFINYDVRTHFMALKCNTRPTSTYYNNSIIHFYW